MNARYWIRTSGLRLRRPTPPIGRFGTKWHSLGFQQGYQHERLDGLVFTHPISHGVSPCGLPGVVDAIPGRESKSFIGRPGVLHVARVATDLWQWRIDGLHNHWLGDAESLAEALDQAAQACGMAHFEARWREVRP